MASGLNETKISKKNNSNFRTQRVMMMLADVCVCVGVGGGGGWGGGEGGRWEWGGKRWVGYH